VVEQEPPRRLLAARFVAPLAFVVAATILIVLIQRGLNGGSADTVTTATPPATSPTTTVGTTGPTKKRFYRVKSGDTLESIAAKFHTTVDDLITLNPDVDPLALSPRQKIRVA
jgi:LysM repeat protein